MRKLSLSLIIFVFLALPIFVLAQGTQEGTSQTSDNTQSGQAATTGQQGNCQSGSGQGCQEQKRENSADKINVKLQIPLPFVPLNCEGGTVCKLTDYLAGVYRMLIGVGALFAVVMIIIAGYQWIFSGGSADRIGAAKKRIIGACMGLILALLSYVILNSISARLVELRLPLVDPVQQILWGGSGACYNPTNDNEKWATIEKNQGLPVGKLKVTSKTTGKVEERDKTLCGQKYALSGAEGECSGIKCTDANGVDSGDSCIEDKCQKIFLYGNITNIFDLKNLAQAATGGGRVAELGVYQVCGLIPNKIDGIDFSGPSGSAKYAFSTRLVGTGTGGHGLNLDQQCILSEKGYGLSVRVSRSLGEDDMYFLGKNCQSLKKASGAKWFDFTFVGNIAQEQLWQKSDFTGQAQRCDLDLTNKDQFPPM